MNEDKRNLPIFKERENILDSVKKNAVTIIIGDTGCGKSTQVPQYLISAGYEHLVCTQPRRLSTISLSERVAKEMFCEETGDVGDSTGLDALINSSLLHLLIGWGLIGRLDIRSALKVVVMDES